MNKIKDWLEKHGLKGRKLYAVIGAVAVLAVVFVLASLPKKEREPRPDPKADQSTPSASFGALANQAGGSIQMPAVSPEFFNVRVQNYMQENDRWKQDRLKFEAEVLGLLRDLREHGTADTGIKKEMEDLRAQVKNAVDLLQSAEARAAGEGRQGPRKVEASPLQLIPAPERKPGAKRDEAGRSGALRGEAGQPGESPYYLPAGSMVKATLLNGVEAPPATQGPGLPAVLLVGGKFVGPNGYTIPMKGCMAMGKADGDLSSERVKVGVTLFSCVFPGGRTLDRPIQAYVSGPDGKVGIPGKVHDRRGRQLGMAALAGFAAGLSQAIGQSEVTRVLTAEGTERTIISGSALTFGMSQALNSALAEVAIFYRNEMAKLFPIVVVPSGVEVTLVMEQGLDIPEIANLFGAEGEAITP